MNSEFGYIDIGFEKLLVPSFGSYYPSQLGNEYVGLIRFPYVKKVNGDGTVDIDGVIDNVQVYGKTGPIPFTMEVAGNKVIYNQHQHPEGTFGAKYTRSLSALDPKYSDYYKFDGSVKLTTEDGNTPLFIAYDEINVWMGTKGLGCAIRFAR